jgi:hypothetical protein
MKVIRLIGNGYYPALLRLFCLENKVKIRFLLIVALLVSFITSLQAQTLEDADLLFAKKQYEEAAAMYYQLYYFNKSADTYQMRIDELLNNKKPQPQAADLVKPLMMKAEKLARMLSRCEDIQIVDSLIVNKNNFLQAYFVGDETGSFEQTNTTVIYENQLKDSRYFGKMDANGFFRLNSQLKIQDSWSDAKPLNLHSESEADDNYPFVMPDGLTIYYASTGNGSIGGYDLFVSRYNLNNDTYLAPNQMGMPFNSIYNDYMLVIDEVNDIGYFASDRFQPEDKVVIYTFIPNNEFKPIDSKDEQVLMDRAKITSIRDTWLPNVNYLSKIETIKANIEKTRHKVKKDFTFIINDNIVYYTLTDFESDAAKNSYLQSKDLEEKIRTLEEQLDTQRKAFARGNSTQKQSLRSSILANEQRLETIVLTYNKLLIETRNSEIKYLRIKN